MKTFNQLIKRLESNFSFFKILVAGIVLSNVYISNVAAQSIKVIPNPDDGSYSGYPIIYNNKIYFQYYKSNSLFSFQLAQYDGNVITTIPNPDSSGYFQGYVIYGFNDLHVNPFVYQNKLCIQYTNSSGQSQMGQYDGNTLTLLPNPDTLTKENGYYYSSIFYNNKQYLKYENMNRGYQLVELNSQTLSLIPNLQAHETVSNLDAFPFVYNNNLYCVVDSLTNVDQLLQYDGISTAIIPNANSGDAEFGGYPFVYNNKLNFELGGALAQYSYGDSVRTISNPNYYTGILSFNHPILFNNKIYIRSQTLSGSSQLAQYNGVSVTLIPNPDQSSNPFPDAFGEPSFYSTIYNNELYFEYVTESGLSKLAKFDGNTITLISDQDTGSIFFGPLIVYNNKLYGGYSSSSSPTNQLAQFDGNSIKIVSNPNSRDYVGFPIIYNNKLYFKYGDDNGGFNLAYISDTSSVMPLKFINFSSTLLNNNVQINWQTASEENTNYFNIERSNDAVHFNIINKINAAGNSTITKKYTYTDIGVTKLNVSGLYYRLQEVDKDGKINYSGIKTVEFFRAHSFFSISPNPTKDFINIISSFNVTAAQVKITDMDGKALFTTKQNFVAGQRLKISISPFLGKVLIVTIVSNDNQEHFKIVRE